MYVVVTRYQKANGKRPITHAYAEDDMSKKRALALKSQIIREHRKFYPNDKGELTAHVLKIIDISMLNKNFEVLHTDSINARNTRRELQGPHQGPSGEPLI